MWTHDELKRLLTLANLFLALSVLTTLVALIAAYGFEAHFSLKQLIGLHIVTVVAPALVKISYVARLVAQKYLGQTLA